MTLQNIHQSFQCPPPASYRQDCSQREILFVKVSNALFPISPDVMLKVCDQISPVSRVVIITGPQRPYPGRIIKLLVEFFSVQGAQEVKSAINGADIYDDCCTLSVDFAHPRIRGPLRVNANTDWSWDRRLESGVLGERRTLLLEEPTSQQLRKRPRSPGLEDLNSNYEPLSKERLRNPEQRRQQSVIRGPVLMVYDVCPEKMTADRIFNLFCSYGDVIKVKFLLSKSGCCMVEMSDAGAVFRVIEFLNQVPIFGRPITIRNCRQLCVRGEMNANARIGNGTPVFMDYTYSPDHRFCNRAKATKNRVVEPSVVLHYYNLPDNIKIDDLLVQKGAKMPIKIRMFPTFEEGGTCSGLVEFQTLEESTEALALCNNANACESVHKRVRLCYSSHSKMPPHDKYHQPSEPH